MKKKSNSTKESKIEKESNSTEIKLVFNRIEKFNYPIRMKFTVNFVKTVYENVSCIDIVYLYLSFSNHRKSSLAKKKKEYCRIFVGFSYLTFDLKELSKQQYGGQRGYRKFIFYGFAEKRPATKSIKVSLNETLKKKREKLFSLYTSFIQTSGK